MLATSILLACLIVLGELASVGRRHARDAEQLTAAQLVCRSRLNEILAGAAPLESQAASDDSRTAGLVLQSRKSSRSDVTACPPSP